MIPVEQQKLVQDSFAQIYQHKAQIGAVCYDHLAGLCPGAAALFGKGFSSHNLMLVTELALLVRAQSQDTPSPQILRLIRFHAAKGVQPDHFPAMRACLLHAISVVMGPAFTPELANAWGAAFDHLAQQMTAAT